MNIEWIKVQHKWDGVSKGDSVGNDTEFSW